MSSAKLRIWTATIELHLRAICPALRLSLWITPGWLSDNVAYVRYTHGRRNMNRRLFSLGALAAFSLFAANNAEARKRGSGGGGGKRNDGGSSAESRGCGSRGGAGFRKANGKCADRNGK
jgi:uncharacterized membrane protein YgcG